MSDPNPPQPAGNPALDPTPAQPPASGAATFTQDQLNAALAEEKRKWKRQQDEAAAELKRTADDAAAAQRGEFEKLANDRQTRLSQIEAEQQIATEQLAAYREAMEKQIKARLKDLPEEIRDLDPGGDVLSRYEWLTKAQAAAAKLSGTKPPIGTPPGPRGSGGTPAIGSTPDLIAQKKASGGYDL